MKFLRFLVYLPAIAWSVTIFVLSTRVAVQVPDVGLSVDKIGHLLAYGLLTWLLLWAWKKTNRLKVLAVVCTVLASSLYGVSMEFVQWFFFPGRFFEVWDMIANITGASISGTFSLWLQSKTKV